MKKLSVLFIPILVVLLLAGCAIYDSTPGWDVTSTTDITLNKGDSVEITATVTHVTTEIFLYDVNNELLSDVVIWYYYKDASDNTLFTPDGVKGLTILSKNIASEN